MNFGVSLGELTYFETLFRKGIQSQAANGGFASPPIRDILFSCNFVDVAQR